MTAILAALLAAILPTSATVLRAPQAHELPHWSQCDPDDAECDAQTEDDGDWCYGDDCAEDD